MQTTPRSAKRAALRRDAASRPRARLTPRPRSLQPPGTPPPGAPPRYGEIPDAAKEALDRSTADFTAGRLSERAQHARQAAARAAGAHLLAGQGAGQPGEPPADQAASPGAGQSGEPGADQPAGPDPRADAASPAAAGEAPTVQWAWRPIAAMTAPLLLLLLVLLA